MLDPGLATRGPRPTLTQLHLYQFGNPSVMYAPRGASATDWRILVPNPAAVRGYPSDPSVVPGGTLELHLSGSDTVARLDIFRIGLADASLVATVPEVRWTPQPEAARDPRTGLVEEHWPVSARMPVPADWRSGFYLAKLTGRSGGQSYVPFVVRATQPQPLMVVLPFLAYQAYNTYGSSSLYSWSGGPLNRALAVSFDRPYDHEAGAALFFRLDFPLIVWLEDHGYEPAYVTDLDVARAPSLIRGARTIIFSGHGEYWTKSLRDEAESAGRQGSNLLFFGANQAFWQVRLEASGDGRPDRRVVGYKSASLDPLAATDPGSATTRFEDPPVNRPPGDFMGFDYGGIVVGIQPMIVGPGMATFAPDLGLRPGRQLPGLIGGEVDVPSPDFSGVLLGATPVTVGRRTGVVTAATGLWVNPSGSRVFDAGTFDFAWGLDPRYAAALTGFPAEAWGQLTARILAWAGAQPTR
jgi:hypothetical protein